MSGWLGFFSGVLLTVFALGVYLGVSPGGDTQGLSSVVYGESPESEAKSDRIEEPEPGSATISSGREESRTELEPPAQEDSTVVLPPSSQMTDLDERAVQGNVGTFVQPITPASAPAPNSAAVEELGRASGWDEADVLSHFVFWDAFRSERSARGFARRLSINTGIDVAVISEKDGYRVALPYSNDAQRLARIRLIETQTGLHIGEGTR